MKLYFIALLTFILFGGCQEENKPTLNGKKLLEQKCNSCHNIALPPSTYENEVAPPMMAVAFHVESFMNVTDESQRTPKTIEFVKDYVLNPQSSKSLCDKESLQSYGVMPSQKGKVTTNEVEAIASYMFRHFTQKNLLEAQEHINKLNTMPKGEKIALQNGCLGCHKVDKKIVGPSFKTIARKYKNDTNNTIQHSINYGSKGKYKEAHGAMMPPFQKKLTQKQILSIEQWISSL